MILKIENKLIDLVGKEASESNISVYVVGGFVRDYILKRQSKDIDFVVLGDSMGFAKKVAQRLHKKKVITFPRFLTARIPDKEFDLEFVEARSEIYEKNSRKPIVKAASLKTDLSRRDFTINALAAKINGTEKGKIIDFYSGISDIKNKIIRTPLDPDITYSDDPLRMLRAIRFAVKLNYTIEKQSFEFIKKNSYRIKIISVERITDEFFKILESSDPVYGLKLLDESNLLEKIFPELTNLKGIEIQNGIGHKDNFIHSLKVLQNVSDITTNLKMRIAALFHDIGKHLVKHYNNDSGWTFHGHDHIGSKLFLKISKRMNWSGDIANEVSKLIALHHRPISLAQNTVTDSGVRRFLFEGGNLVDDLMILCRGDITTQNKSKLNKFLKNYDILAQKIIKLEEKDKLRNFKCPVSGNDIMNFLDIKQGKIIGKIKSQITEAIISGKINNSYKEAFGLLQKITKTLNSDIN